MNQSGERTEKATPKKRKDARAKGQVRKSTEVNTAVTLIIMFSALKVFGQGLVDGLADLMTKFLSGTATYVKDISYPDITNSMAQALVQFATIAAPMLIVAMLAGIFINVVQVKFLFSTKALKPSFGKLNPLKGIKRMFSMKTLIELIKSVLKLIVIAVLAYGQITMYQIDYIKSMRTTVGASAVYIVSAIIDTALLIGVALLILSGFDYLYQWWRYEKDLKMTKHEVKMEHKQMEGDPQIKGKIKQKQLQMAAMRMMQDVPDADVVITNPTHYAVALKYDSEKGAAPVVLAKGVDYVAQRIKEIAREAGVEMYEDRALAQSLYKLCEPGREIPFELYQAVAEILAHIYKMRK